jgi:L-fuconolactonase
VSLRIDSHMHLWRIARGDHGWIEPGSPLDRDFTLGDLRPHLRDVEALVLVQAAPTDAETHYLLEQAAISDGLIKAVIGWADLAAPDAPARIEALARNPLLRGLRPMLQDLPDAGWILRPDIAPALAAMRQAGLTLDLLVKPHQLPALLRLADRHPDLPMVLDHGGKPAIGSGEWRSWAGDVARLARETGIVCKLSGLITEAGAGWSPGRLRPCADHLLDCFGASRVMWGSDWPVVTVYGSYQSWRETADALTASLPLADRTEIFGGTAARFYGMK